jgi:FKBP-type peptidyl-prolyl cis-trans isomerase SlyD
MKVAPGTIVTLEYDITDESGEVLETSDIGGAITFLHGQSGLIPGLDKRLLGMDEGQESTFEFPPEEAFGRIEDAPKRTLGRAELPGHVAVGAQFEAGVAGGQRIKLRVAEVSGEQVVVQMIHPLCGQRIGMSVKIVGVRAPTSAERAAGKAMIKPPPPPPPKS